MEREDDPIREAYDDRMDGSMDNGRNPSRGRRKSETKSQSSDWAGIGRASGMEEKRRSVKIRSADRLRSTAYKF